MVDFSLEANTNNPFLSYDALAYICDQNPEAVAPFLSANRLLRSIAERFLTLAQHKISRELPSLFATGQTSNMEGKTPALLFLNRVKKLHSEAKEFDCDQPYQPNLPFGELLSWEIAHYEGLIEEIQTRTEIAKAEDFHSFVKAVGKALGHNISPSEDPRKVWEDFLDNESGIREITELNLFKAHLRFLPPEISQLPNIETLHLGSNQLRELPAEIAMLKKLTIVDLSENRFEKVPDELGLLSNLKTLKLNGNRLNEFPSLPGLQNLTYLDLGNNPLRSIPSTLSSLPQLKYLYLNHASITSELKDDFTLSNLEELYLCNNQIDELDEERLVQMFPLVRKLFLYNNPLTSESEATLERIRQASPFLFDIQWKEDHFMDRWED